MKFDNRKNCNFLRLYNGFDLSICESGHAELTLAGVRRGHYAHVLVMDRDVKPSNSRSGLESVRPQGRALKLD